MAVFGKFFLQSFLLFFFRQTEPPRMSCPLRKWPYSAIFFQWSFLLFFIRQTIPLQMSQCTDCAALVTVSRALALAVNAFAIPRVFPMAQICSDRPVMLHLTVHNCSGKKLADR